MRLSVEKASAQARKLEKRGDFDAAHALYAELLGQYSQNRRVAGALEALIERTGNPPIETLKALEAAYHRRDYAAVIGTGTALAASFPRSVTLWNILGAAALALKEAKAAEASFRQALAIHPQNVDALSNLGVALKAQNRFDEALASYAAAAEFAPNNASILFNLANLLRGAGRQQEAIAAFEKAARARPGDAEARFSIASILQEAGDGPAAVDHAMKALAIDPDHARARALAMHQLCHLCDFEGLEAHRSHVETLGLDGQAIEPFALIALDDSPGRFRQRSEAWAGKIAVPSAPLPARPVSDSSGRIRLGYFSADFHNHATMYLISQVFAHHDRGRFEIAVYSYGGKEDAAIGPRLRQAAGLYRDVAPLPDTEIVQLARADGLDVAVDLKGYTKGARPGIFAARVAPVQISYLGFPGTMGAPFIDYLVADEVIIPESHAQHYSEAVIRLPHSYQPTDETRAILQDASSRSDHGLPETGFVFCGFNATYKIQPRDFAVWMRLLSTVGGSVLWLLKSNDWAQANLRATAKAAGIDPDRLVFAPPIGHLPHLSRHRHADLFLDTFTCNAHTTASDALWAGLPLVTRIGEQFAARVAASVLNAAGLPELVTQTDAAYEELALGLATDPARLAAVKAKLAAARSTAPLFDSAGYTRHLEAAFAAAHRRQLAGEAPAPIRIAAGT